MQRSPSRDAPERDSLSAERSGAGRAGALAEEAPQLTLTGRTILVATDGSGGSAGAVRVAAALARQHRATVHALTVVDTRSAPIPPPLDVAIAIGDALTGPAVHEARVTEVRATFEAATGVAVDWPVRVMLGTPAMAVAAEARRLDAALVVVGLRRHGRLERAVRDETALTLMRHATCPVLGVVPEATGLPSRILVALDFSATSLAAARAASAIAGEDADIVLAYVPPLLIEHAPDDGERLVHTLGVETAFARISRQLSDAGSRLDHVVLHRDRPRPISEILLEYAEGAHIDCLAAGSARHGRLERWLLGSVSTELVRDGRQSILVVPPSDAVRRRGEGT